MQDAEDGMKCKGKTMSIRDGGFYREDDRIGWRVAGSNECEIDI